MNNFNRNTPISAALLASKLAGVKNYEDELVFQEMSAQPRFAEMLLFLQWVSEPENYAGGLRQFSRDLLSESEEMIGTDEMLQIGPREQYTQDEESAVRSGIDSQILELGFEYDPESAMKPRAASERVCRGSQDYSEICSEYAQRALAVYLYDLCETPGVTFTRKFFKKFGFSQREMAPWYFPRICESILAFMDRRKARIAATIGETTITREIFKWLDVALRAKRTVMIIGTERFGKTEAVKNWCLQNPGIARMVKTPDSNALSDLLREVAKAIGIQSGPDARGYKLRETIDHVLSQSGLMLVMDESQFLVPGSYSKSTSPARLNWFRINVMNKGIPSALVATPQSYKPSKDRFVKKTGFAIGQFDERILKTVSLPDELEKADLLAIARVHFPTLKSQYLEFVVERAIATERNYVSDIEKIATLARVSAEQSGRETPILADIQSAIADVLPALPPAPEATPAPKEYGRRGRGANPAQGRSKKAAPRKRVVNLPASRCNTPAEPDPVSFSRNDFSSHDRQPILTELAG